MRRTGPTLLRELAIRAHSEPITHALLDDYPPSNTLHRIRHLLVLAGVLPQRTELLDRIEPWLEQLLNDRPHHHTAVVRPFVDFVKAGWPHHVAFVWPHLDGQLRTGRSSVPF